MMPMITARRKASANAPAATPKSVPSRTLVPGSESVDATAGDVTSAGRAVTTGAVVPDETATSCAVAPGTGVSVTAGDELDTIVAVSVGPTDVVASAVGVDVAACGTTVAVGGISVAVGSSVGGVAVAGGGTVGVGESIGPDVGTGLGGAWVGIGVAVG